MITFSIITITYNAASVLQPTLDSVLEQTHDHVEHIIVDGASRDETVAMAEAYRQRSDAADDGHTVCLKSEPDRGLYDAMNKGLQRATGDYVLFLNAGDRFPSKDTLALIEQHASAMADGAELPAVLYGDTDIVDADGNFLRHRHHSVPQRLSWRSFRRGMLVCHQAFYARRDLAQATPYDLQYSFSADVDWCIRVMRKAAEQHLPLCHVPGVVAHYLDGGTTVKNHRASLRERFDVMRRHYGLLTTLAMHVWFVVRRK